jgi:hypothetical protein
MRRPERSLCGVDRWNVKTLQDRPALLPVRTTTIRYLVSRPAPHLLPRTRLPFERHIFRVTASITLFRVEDDGDLHLVLRDPKGLYMIAEAPSPGCVNRSTLLPKVQMLNARRAASLCARPPGAPAVRAVVTGVAFFDFKHGQTGVAPNAIELHPILKFRCLG